MIKLNKNLLGNEELEGLIKVFKSGNVTQGKYCREFEKKFAEKVNSKYALFVNSGSSANLLSFFCISNPLIKLNNKIKKKKFKPNAEIIVCGLSWSTTVWPILQCGAKPVFVDCDPLTLQINEKEILKSINKNTIGVCVVHVLGNGPNINSIKKICDKKKLWLIEDTCESLGAKYKSKNLGTFGDFGTYSFYFSHHITTIEGGMVVTNNKYLYENMKMMRAHGWIRDLSNHKYYEKKYPGIDPKYLFISSGFNLRSNELSGIIGIKQLKKLDNFNKKRNKIAKIWSDTINKSNLLNIMKPMKIEKDIKPAWFGFPIVFKNKEILEKFKKILKKNKVESRPIICGNMLRQPAIKHYKYSAQGKLPNCDKIMQDGIYIGSSPKSTKQEINKIKSIFKNFDNRL